MQQVAEYVDSEDTGWFGSSIVKSVKKAAKGVAHGVSSVAKTAGHAASAITKSPVWDIAQTGASFIPGVGTAVSSGMAAAAALGRGQSLRDAALRAARAAVPGGPVAQAAFDVAVGAAKGQRLDNAALGAVRNQLPGGEAARAAFDAGVAIAKGHRADRAVLHAARAELGRSGRRVFDRALGAANRAVGTPRFGALGFPQLSSPARQVARTFAAQPRLRALRASQVARRLKVATPHVRQAQAAWLGRFGRRAFDWRRDVGDFDSLDGAAQRHSVALPDDFDAYEATPDVGEVFSFPPVAVSRNQLVRLCRADPSLCRAVQSHGLLAELAHNTGELDGKGGWIIRSGDLPYKVALAITGDANRWKELPSVNPGMVFKNNTLSPWNVGQLLKLPPSWIAATLPEITVPAPATSTAPATTSTPANSSGGPPFPPPSSYPQGYPSPYYIVQSGDYGIAIAKRITGDGNRWTELRKANPSTSDPKYGMKITVGQKLTLPSSWVKPAAPPVVTPAPAPVTEPGEGVITSPGLPTWPPDLTKFPWTTPPGYTPPTATFPSLPEPSPAETAPPLEVPPPIPIPTTLPPAVVPTSAPSPAAPETPAISGSQQQVAAVQVQLGYFFKAHSDATWAVADAPFGTYPSDYAGEWNQRSFQAMAAFQKWWNAHGKSPKLRTDGMPDAQSIAALRTQVDEDLGVSKPPVKATPQTKTAAKASGGGAAPLLAALAAGYFIFK